MQCKTCVYRVDLTKQGHCYTFKEIPLPCCAQWKPERILNWGDLVGKTIVKVEAARFFSWRLTFRDGSVALIAVTGEGVGGPCWPTLGDEES